VALFGRPSAGPLMASISSIEYWPDSSARNTWATPYTPMWFAMKVRPVFRDDDALAQAVVGEPRDALHHGLVGVAAESPRAVGGIAAD